MSQYVIQSPLFLNTTENGVVIPRLTTSQKNAISTPIQGTLVYDTTQNDFNFYNGSYWIPSGYSLTGGAYTTTSTDAFGRLRVSNPFTLFDSSYRYKDNEKFYNTIIGTGTTGTFNTNASLYEMSLTGANSSLVRTSTKVFPYQPGKSLLVLTSFCFSPQSTGLTQSVGYFNSENGVYFKQSNNTKYICMRSSSSGALSEHNIPQSSWNRDPLDGSGPSGITLNTNSSQILFTDFEWLGVGSVRVGFVINGAFIVAHQFDYANGVGNNSTYMTTATLPVRYSIESDGTYSSGGSTLKQICSTVISEGGYQGTSVKQYAYSSANKVTSTTTKSSPNQTPLFSIRVDPSRPDSVILPSQVDMIITTSPDTILYELVLGGTLSYAGASGTWTNVNTKTSNMQFNNTFDPLNTTLSGGTVIDARYLSSTSLSPGPISTEAFQFNVQLGKNTDGTPQILTVCATAFSSTADVCAGIGWYELV
jgi:hypothetical protein